MPKIPVVDYLGNPLLACLFLVLLWLQWRFPLRRQHFSVRHRSHAQNSCRGLSRQPTAGLPVSRPALASMAIPTEATTFQCASPARTEFCALDSRLCNRSACDVAHSDFNRDVGAAATRRVIELVSPADVGRGGRGGCFFGFLQIGRARR